MGKPTERVLELYSPHAKQLEFHSSQARYRVISTGRQFGKSTMAMNELAFRAWEKPRTNYWYLSPIFSQAKDQYRKLIHILPVEVVLKKSETELRIELINGSSIEFKSGEVLDRLRGATLHGVVIDEVRDQHAELWPLVIRPMLSVTKGWAAFISTPCGFDAFYDLCSTAQINESKEWMYLTAPSTANPFFSKSEEESARRNMSENEFRQEILAEFVRLHVGTTYKSYGPHNQLLKSPFVTNDSLISPHLPIVVGLDFNVGLLCWTLGQTNGVKWYFFDEIAIPNSNTDEAAPILVNKCLRHPHIQKLGVVLCGDATGKARKTSAAGETDYSIILKAFKDAGIPVRNETPESNPIVKDRVNAMNSSCRAANGEVVFYHHPIKCAVGKKDLERVTWKEGAQGAILDQITDPMLTHMSDAYGYPIYFYSKLFKESPGVPRIRMTR